MYKEHLKVYDEDLNNAGKSGVVKAQGNMGGLSVKVYAIADAANVKKTTVEIKHGDTPATANTIIGSIAIALSENPVVKGQLMGSFVLPEDVKKYVTATLQEAGAADKNFRVTLDYLPR